ncbi:heterogeneous nuclear ribonucleoproteins A2/B1-like [Actinia tenebrosa]|uniref:Heterogeneous nuclear ribonucleoproteins A2/B1-like n=1 Tax=Actinia tenebrosa TaxID=6105 RepID=A0A6P8H0W0_ACTTE|nr:heterogeneous nuclear ribonucleoproteins A2/B1-like [Actinia tenebrosa]
MPIRGSGKGDDIGKIFVGGLGPNTSKESLQDYFEKFGQVTDCVLMTDPINKHSRGFGFVTFSDPSTVQKVVNTPVHQLDGKNIDPKPAVPRGPGQALQTGVAQQKVNNNELKVFIGGIAIGTTEEDIKQYFSGFAEVKNVQLIAEKGTKKPRGFGFVTFDTKEAVNKAVDMHYHQINGKMVEVKIAEHRMGQPKMPFGGQANPLATPVHGMPGAMGRGQFGQQYGMQSAYPQQAGVGRGGYNANAGYGAYGAVGAGANYGYGAPQTPQGYGAAGMPMGGAPASGAGYTPAAYGAAPQMPGYGVGAGREPAAPAYGATPGPGAGVPAHGEAPAGGDYSAYSAYGLGNYQQQDSQYGPARGSFGSEAAYSAYPAGDSYASAGGPAGYGAGGSAGESFGRGGGAARGFHPYGR